MNVTLRRAREGGAEVVTERELVHAPFFGTASMALRMESVSSVWPSL